MKPEQIFRPDYEKIYVIAATPDRFPQLAREHMDGWDKELLANDPPYKLAQLAMSNDDWFAAFLWRQAESQSILRDRFLGWHPYQQAERISLVLECTGFHHRWEACYQKSYAINAQHAALSLLQKQWEQHFGYKPLMVDCHLEPDKSFPDYFQGAGWIRTTEKNPRKLTSHWMKELVPGAKEIITANELDPAYTGGTSSDIAGLLPIRDELLPSLRDAFKKVRDRREVNRHFPQSSIVATAFLALICGYMSVNAIVKFAQRLSARQAGLLGFNVDGNGRIDMPGYHTFYRVLGKLDRLQLSECFIRWLEANEKDLSRVLHPPGPVIRDALSIFVRHLGIPYKPPKPKFDPPPGMDPDAPGGLRRDANGKIIS